MDIKIIAIQPLIVTKYVNGEPRQCVKIYALYEDGTIWARFEGSNKWTNTAVKPTQPTNQETTNG
jgi:hypothetical protein